MIKLTEAETALVRQLTADQAEECINSLQAFDGAEAKAHANPKSRSAAACYAYMDRDVVAYLAAWQDAWDRHAMAQIKARAPKNAV